jgi:hypothetical protein
MNILCRIHCYPRPYLRSAAEFSAADRLVGARRGLGATRSGYDARLTVARGPLSGRVLRPRPDESDTTFQRGPALAKRVTSHRVGSVGREDERISPARSIRSLSATIRIEAGAGYDLIEVGRTRHGLTPFERGPVHLFVRRSVTDTAAGRGNVDHEVVDLGPNGAIWHPAIGLVRSCRRESPRGSVPFALRSRGSQVPLG